MGRWKLAALGVGLVLAGAACAGKAGSTASSKPGAGAVRPTVSVRDVMGVGSVLTDASGLSLYTPDQEAGGTIHCTGDCVKIWIPLRAPAGGAPTKGSGVNGTVGTLNRPDGITQVTFDGKPLYRFAQDSAPGDVNGNGAQDSFGGTSLTWHAATVGASGVPTSPGSSSGSGGGYGY